MGSLGQPGAIGIKDNSYYVDSLIFGNNCQLLNNDSKVCNQNAFCNSSDERYLNNSEGKLILKSYSSSSTSVNPIWVHYYLQCHDCQSYSKSNESNNVSDVDLLADGSIFSKDVAYRSHPVVDSFCQTPNIHPLYDCQSKIDTRSKRYGSDAEIPVSSHMHIVQTMAIFNWYTYNADSTVTKLVYLYPQMDCILKGFYWAKSDRSNSYWDLSICSYLPSGFLEVHQYCFQW